MPLPTLDCATEEDLLDAVQHADRPLAFLVGAPMSMPRGGDPGVPDVAGMIELVRKRVSTRGLSSAAFDQEVTGGPLCNALPAGHGLPP